MKTSKKLISIIVAIALLISTIAAVTTLTSSATDETSSEVTTAAATTSANLVKKAFYNFKPANTGDTFKTEGWIPKGDEYPEGYWGPTCDLTVSCQKDGSVYYSTADGLTNYYGQINSDWKNVPAIGDKEVYLDFTNNLSVAIKVKLQYSDANTTTLPAGATKTLKVTEVSEKGVLNIMIQNAGTNLPSQENSFLLSALYTLEEADPNAPTTTEVTEPETEPETTTKAVDPSNYTAGSYFSKYGNLHYAKSEGWYTGAVNLDNISDFISVDPKGVFTINIPAGNMNSAQVTANYSLDGTEKSRMAAAIEEAKKGTGKLMFDLTLAEAKDKNGKDVASVKFKYGNIAGQSIGDSNMVTLTAGKTVRVVVDVTSATADNLKGSFQFYFRNADNNSGLTVFNVSATPIVVAVDASQAETTTEAPATTTEEVPATTTEEVPATTTEAVETTTEEVVINKTNPASDSEFTLYNPETDMDKFIVSLDKTSGKVGDIVEFSASIKNNPGLFAGNMCIKYDSDVLSPVLVKMGTDMVAETVKGDILPSVTAGTVNEVVDEDGNELGYQLIPFIMENSEMENTTNDGVLFTFKFEIIAKPSYGTSTNVVFTNADDTSFYGLDLETFENVDLSPVFEEGVVEIKEDAPVETTTEETPVETTTEETPAETTTVVDTPDVTTAEETSEVIVKPELVSEADFVAFDDSEFGIIVDTVEGKAGTTVDVNITLNNNPGIWSGTLFLAYDPAVITPVEIPDPDGNPWNVVEYKNVMAGVDVTNAFLLDYVVDDYNFGMLPVSFSNGALKNFTENGILATVTFQIADDAKVDDFSNIVFVNYTESKINNTASALVDFTIKEGKVTVIGDPQAETTTEETPVETTTGETPVATTTGSSDVPAATTKAPAGADSTTANANVETPDATTTASNGSNGGNGSSSDDVGTGAAAAPIAALAIAAGAAFVAFKARKK